MLTLNIHEIKTDFETDSESEQSEKIDPANEEVPPDLLRVQTGSGRLKQLSDNFNQGGRILFPYFYFKEFP